MSFSYGRDDSLGQSMMMDDDFSPFVEYDEEELDDYNEDAVLDLVIDDDYEDEFIMPQESESLEKAVNEFGEYLFVIELRRFKSSYDFLKYDKNYGNLLDLIDYFRYLLKNKRYIKKTLEDIRYVAEMNENYDKVRFEQIVSSAIRIYHY